MSIMFNIDKNILPKRISLDGAHMLIGEGAHWFCPACRKWRTSTITKDGIACSICGGGPDWKKHPPTLSYKSRSKQVAKLCAEGSPWRDMYIEAEERYSNFIESLHSGDLPLQAQKSGWEYFHSVWREADQLADFLLTAKDGPATEFPHAYSEQGLQRRYYDPRRKHNIVSMSGLNLQPEFDEGGARFTDEEIAELISIRASHRCGRPHKGVATERYEQLCDKYFKDEFLNGVRNPLEHSIALDFSGGASKRDIERQYGLTERQVRTKVSHIAKALKTHE